jgi:LacI family transcriptional regulator
MPVTLKDIAEAAGVTIATASRSLTGAYGVHRATRERVLAVAERLKYRPNRVARGLATGRSHTLGLVISDIRNPFFAELARGAEDAACAAGCEVILCNSDLDCDKQMSYTQSLLEKRVDGIIMNSVAGLSRAQQQQLEDCGAPIVLLNRPRGTLNFSTVCTDNARGGELAGEYLARLGHRVIAHLTGPKDHGNLSDRCSGFLKGIQARRTGVEPIIIHGDHTFHGGYEMARKLFTRRRDVTAIFAGNDVIAFGVVRAAIENGLRIPDDLSLVGFDNVELSGILHPPLTTVHQPKYEIGQAAVEILLRLSKDTNGRTPEHRLLGVQLIERQSCRSLKR